MVRFIVCGFFVFFFFNFESGLFFISVESWVVAADPNKGNLSEDRDLFPISFFFFFKGMLVGSMYDAMFSYFGMYKLLNMQSLEIVVLI